MTSMTPAQPLRLTLRVGATVLLSALLIGGLAFGSQQKPDPAKPPAPVVLKGKKRLVQLMASTDKSILTVAGKPDKLVPDKKGKIVRIGFNTLDSHTVPTWFTYEDGKLLEMHFIFKNRSATVEPLPPEVKQLFADYEINVSVASINDFPIDVRGMRHKIFIKKWTKCTGIPDGWQLVSYGTVVMLLRKDIAMP